MATLKTLIEQKAGELDEMIPYHSQRDAIETAPLIQSALLEVAREAYRRGDTRRGVEHCRLALSEDYKPVTLDEALAGEGIGE